MIFKTLLFYVNLVSGTDNNLSINFSTQMFYFQKDMVSYILGFTNLMKFSNYISSDNFFAKFLLNLYFIIKFS